VAEFLANYKQLNCKDEKSQLITVRTITQT